jgi:hypothetical protein
MFLATMVEPSPLHGNGLLPRRGQPKMPTKPPARDATKDTSPPELLAITPPPYRGTAAGYDFYLQSIVEIQKSVGGIESSIKHLCERTQAHETKLDDIAEDVHELSKDVHGAKIIAWSFGIICSILGAVGLAFLNKILDIVVAHLSSTPALPGH